MGRSFQALALLLALAGGCPGAGGGESPETPPVAEVARLVARLGDPSFEVREAAQQALLELGCDRPEGTLALLPVEPGDPEVRQRCEALRQQIPLEALRRRMLREAGEDAALKQAVDAVLDGPSPGTIKDLLARVAPAGRGGALAGLWAWLLENPGADVRTSAAGALGILREKSAAPRLTRLLGDADAEVRCRAAVALVALGEASMAPQFVKLLEDPGEGAGQLFPGPSMVRVHAAIALVALRDASVVPRLVQLLESPDPELQRQAAGVLDALGEAAASPQVAKLLEDSPADLLGGLGDQAGAPRLVELLEDPGVDLKARAVMALLKLDGQSVVPRLVGLLEDSHAPVRRLSVAALGEAGDRSAVPALEALREDPDEAVRAAVEAALGVLAALPAGLPAEQPARPGR